MKRKGITSRRSVLHTIGSSLAAASLGYSLSPSKADARTKKATAFALIGDRWHNFHYIRTALHKTLVKELGISVDFRGEHTLLNKKNLKGYKLFILLSDGMMFPGGYTTPHAMYDPKNTKLISDPPFPEMDKGGHEMWITPQQGKALKDFVMKGGSALFFHNASYISGANEDFRDVEGALFTGHTQFIPHTLKTVNSDHPITQGIKDFVVTEEQHFLIYDKDPKDVFLRSVNEEGVEFSGDHGNQGNTCEAGWAYEYGKGRVCFMTPGHMISSFWNPEYVKLQKNAVKWLLREI